MLGSLRCATASLVWKTPVASATISEAHVSKVFQRRSSMTRYSCHATSGPTTASALVELLVAAMASVGQRGREYQQIGLLRAEQSTADLDPI